MIIFIIQFALIIITTFLVKSASKLKTKRSNIIVLIGGIVTLLFEPIFITAMGQTGDGGAMQLAGEIFGAYFAIWAFFRIFAVKKKENSTDTTK